MALTSERYEEFRTSPKRSWRLRASDTEQTPERSPEWNLLAAVIEQAVDDLLERAPIRQSRESVKDFPSRQRRWKRDHDSAHEFVFGEHKRFSTMCELLDFDPDVMRQGILARMDARLATGRDGAGETIGARFAAETPVFRTLPAPFVAEATTLVTVAPRALVRLEGAWYSVPCRWAGLDLVARVGATTITIVGRDDTPIRHPRKRFGQRSIDYRHYVPELAKKRW